MADLLISAAAADQDQAERLGQIFVDRGFSVDWLTLDPSEPGARSAILSRRASARATLALWSKHSVADPAVVEEAREGLRRGSLLAARLDDATPPPEFRAAGVANLATWDGSVSSTETGRLLAELTKLLERTATRPALAMAAARLTRSSYGGAAPDLRPRTARAAPAVAAPVPAIAKLPMPATVPAPAPVIAPPILETPAPVPHLVARAEPPVVVEIAKPVAPPAQPLFANAPIAEAPVRLASAANDSGSLTPQLAATTLADAISQSAPVLREVKSAAQQPNLSPAPIAVRTSSPVAASTPDPQFAPIPESQTAPKASLTHLDEMFPNPAPKTRRPDPVAPPSKTTTDEAPTAPASTDRPRKRLIKEPRPRTRQDDINHGFAWLSGLAAAGLFIALWLHERPQDFTTAATQTAEKEFAEAAIVQPQSAPMLLTPPVVEAPAPVVAAEAPVVTPPSALAVTGSAPPAQPKPAETQVAPPAPDIKPASPSLAAATAAQAPAKAAAAPPAKAAATAPKPSPIAAPKPMQKLAAVTPEKAKPAPKLGARIAVNDPPVLRPRRLGVVPKAIAAPKPFTALAAAAPQGAPPTASAASEAPSAPQSGPQSGLSSERLAALGQSLDKTGDAAPKTIEALAKANASPLPATAAAALAGFDSTPSVTALQFEGDATAFHLPGLAPSLLAAWQPSADSPAPTLTVPLTENEWDVAPSRVIAQSALSAGAYADHMVGARLGEPREMLTLGLMRQTGIGAEQDDAIAFAWLRRAALAKDARALSEVGAYYAAGRAASRDDERAVKNFSLSAASGAASGETALGWALASGRGIDQDAVKARALFEAAANKGNALAALNLGRMHADGLGGARDADAAITWYSNAADQGFAPAQYALAVLLLQKQRAPVSLEPSGPAGSTTEPALAALRLQQAAAQGFPDAQALLGALYARGLGVVKDEALAKAWSERARQISQSKAQQKVILAVLQPQADVR
ncbi:MAG: TIR domain-containing protein [Caulobacterales bacterium]